jgi:hypothetical protein
MAIPQKFLRCLVDARNSKSYPGTGTVWTDLSGYNNNFNLANVSYNSAGYFTFNGSTSSGTMTPSTPNGFGVDNRQSTVSVLCRPTLNTAANKPIITDNYGPEWGIWYDGDEFRSYTYGGSAAQAHSINGWANVTMVIDYVARQPLSYTITGGSHTSGTTTLTVNHGSNFIYSASGPSNDRITVSGVSPSGYNGTFALTGATSTTISYAQSNPGAYVSGGTATTKVGNYRFRQYLNGVPTADTAGSVGNGCDDWPITIGFDSQSGSPVNYFTGDIAWIGIWQEALSAAEVNDIYNALRGRM